MALSTPEIEAVVRDLKPKLEGGRIERIDQPDRHKLILSVRKDAERYWLLLCAHPRFSRIHLLTSRPGEGRPAAGFCNLVRQHLTSGPIVALRQMPGDRVVLIESVERDGLLKPHRVTLVAELIGTRSNLLLLDESERILGVLLRRESGRRRLVSGAEYEPLEPPPRLSEKGHINRFRDCACADDPLALSRAIQSHYARLEAEADAESLRSELSGALKTARRRARRRLGNIEADLEQARSAESIRRQAELLMIALPDLEPGQGEVVVEDLFEPERPEVVIKLDPALSPRQNADRLFARYKKAKAAQETLAARTVWARDGLAALEELAERAAAAEGLDALSELRQQIRGLGVTFPEGRAERARRKQKAGPRTFRSADGLEILVARSREENERLTFTIARGNDYWLHLADWPGPHVIIRKPADRSVSQGALLDAAHLAVHFSRIRGAEHAEIVYAQCKNVRRLKGAGRGKVSYSDAGNMRVRMEPERLKRLLSRDAVTNARDEG